MSLRKGSLRGWRGIRRVWHHGSKGNERFPKEEWAALPDAPGSAPKSPGSEQAASCWISKTILREEDKDEDTCFHISLLPKF